MAANLKNNPAPGKKEEARPAGKPEKERFSPDWKWVALGLGFACTSIGATFLGVHFYVQNFLVKERVKTEYVMKMPAKPGPSMPLFATQIANLKGGRFLRYSMVLQYAQNDALFNPEGGGGGHGSAKAGNPVEKFEPMMKDVVVAAISRHSAAELLQPEGRERLKEEIKKDINHELESVYGAGEHGEGSGDAHNAVPEVLRVFFTEFVVS